MKAVLLFEGTEGNFVAMPYTVDETAKFTLADCRGIVHLKSYNLDREIRNMIVDPEKEVT
jgi:hypothetical protein